MTAEQTATQDCKGETFPGGPTDPDAPAWPVRARTAEAGH